MIDVLIFGTLGGIVGARLYYVLFEWEYYRTHLAEIPQIWHGGLAIYGGLFGGILAAYFTCKKIDLNFFKLLDMCGMSFLIGQGIGRWGNFTNQEAFGTNTSMPWGMFSDKVKEYLIESRADLLEHGIEVDIFSPVHPTFLYESIWCIAGFFIIYYIMRKHYRFAGQLILCYGVIYGLERAVVEGFRTDSLYLGDTNIRISQILSAVIAALCFAILIAKFAELKKNPKPYNPVEVLPADKDYVVKEFFEDTKERRSVKKAQKKKIAKQEKMLKGIDVDAIAAEKERQALEKEEYKQEKKAEKKLAKKQAKELADVQRERIREKEQQAARDDTGSDQPTDRQLAKMQKQKVKEKEKQLREGKDNGKNN
jgi:phosphatidylglycerol:prolipoprotein diacylglycerol transferase